MKKIFTLCLVLCMSYLSMGATNLKHEFRATWLTTAWGNDWPKTKATSDATRKQQQDSLIAIFDRLQAGNMNAVCLQVRGRSDAFYQSSYEPWAAELAGARGKDPGYDPLAFAIEEAHKRGLELHAWVNPFRVTSAGTLDANDLVKKNAGQWIIQYNNGSFTGEIIDPGYPEAREYVLNVLMEIISNYDIDGIVMDDYFYPYGGTTTEDAASKALHKPANVVDVNKDGKTDDDWRRSNVDVFLKEFYNRIQTTKPWVRLGMGTFGIWTTQSKVAQAYGISLPSGISGLDDYDEQACNPVEWVQNGYVDYINPQLYWPTTSTGQNYNKLCQWWAKDVCEHFSNQLTNGKKVHFFSSQSISSNRSLTEIQAQVDANRSNLSSGYTGSVFFDTDAYLTMDKDLMTSRFATNALTPPMDWKSKTALSAPTNLTISGTTLTWQHATAERFTVYAYPKGIGVNTATSNPQYLQAVVYDKSFNTSSIGSLDDITIAVYTYDRYGVEHGVALYNADPNATDDPEPEPEPEPEPSNTITWELNGGEVNTSSIEVPSQSDLMLQFMNNYTSYFGTPTSDIDAFYPSNISGFLYRGFQTRGKFVNEMMLDESAGWKWLADYIVSTSASNPTIVAALNSGTEVNWRYSIAAFFEQNGSGTYNVDFSTAGQPSKWGTAYQIAHGAVLLPTYVTSAYTLPTPVHPSGYEFLGWYDNAEFAGSPLTTIPANWTGTLYAQWQENAPTIDPTWQILYTSTDGNVVEPYKTNVFGANIVSNTYENGVGTITFDGPVMSIGDEAFNDCPSLTSITIPNSVTSIGGLAFYNCSSLTSVTIPNSVTNIGEKAFCGCDSITKNNFIGDVASWCDIKFADATANPMYYSHDFCINNQEIHDLVIPNTVDSIHNYAFYDASSLTSITIPNSVTNIGESAFAGCSSITSITIPNSVTSIGSSAFVTNSSLLKTNYTGDVASWCDIKFGNASANPMCCSHNFYINEQEIKDLIIPNTVNSIHDYAFYNCSSLTSITIPNSVTNIGERAFYNCSSLTSITIPNSVTNIGERAFSNCSGLTSIVVENGNAVYDNRDNCNAIIETPTNTLIAGCQNTIIPNSVTSIGSGAFSGCSSLTSITIPNSVTSIGDYAFSDCSSLTSITIPNSVMSIGSGAFSSCSSLTSITIPNSVTNIGSSAFSSCSSLTSITIPNSVTSIGMMAFQFCSSLTSVTIGNGVASIGICTFYYCPSLDTICVRAMTPPTLGMLALQSNPLTAPGNTPSLVCVIPCGTLAAYEASDWEKYVSEFVEEGCEEPIDPTWQITYTSTNGNIVTPYKTNVFGANIVSNEYKDGQGVITFDGPVTSIGNNAFEHCNSLTSITIPNSVTSIGDGAFSDCTSLTSVTIPESVASVGYSAFFNCTSLSSVTLGSGVTSIGLRVFSYCDSLTSMVVEPGNTTYDSRENCNAIIKTATNTLVAGCQSTIIPNSVTSIGEGAFFNCYSLSSLTIPNSVTSIGERAFYYCRFLTSITIPNSVTSIGGNAFSDCYSLDTIHVAATTPPALEDSTVFMGTPSPVCVIPCGTLAAYEASDWASQVGEFVEECVEGQQIIYTSTDGNIVTPYKTNVFGANIVSNTYENGVGTITFDGPVTSIGESAFYGCSSLTSITLPNSVTSIGTSAFEDCTSLTSITIPNSVTSIGEEAFQYCSSLTSITIPNSVTSIGERAFKHCSSLTSMTVENGNTVYDSRENCNAIIETATNTLIAGCQNTIIPNSVTSIGDRAFFGCSSLTSITIPNSVTSIGFHAFSGCSSLTSITIPNGVRRIGDFVFKDCSSLASMVVESGNTTYDSRDNCNAIIETATNTLIAGCQNTIVPNSVTSIGDGAFRGHSSLTSITIPNSVTSIGNGAFFYCSSLDTIYLEATTPPTLVGGVFKATPSPTCIIPCGTLAAYEASDWASQVGEFVEEGCAPIQMCGDDLYWEYADGVLTITGTGGMYDYAADTDVPWYDVRGNIKTVSLPDAMTKIGQNAFYKCTAMTSINMPTSLTAIGEKAFAQDTKLACEIILPASMTTIATRAFFNCQAVTAFHLEATTPPTIPNDAFERTTAPIHVPCGYGHIYGKHTQWGMLNLEMCELLQDNVYYYPIDGHTARAVTYHSNPTDTIVIPSAVVIDGMPRTVTEVADFAFTDCKDIPAIIFNEGLEYIGERAFVRCYGLQGTIVLPATLETIGERAFSYCDNVEKYLIQAMTPPALGDGAFTCANHDALFYVSCEVMDDYKVAARWSSLKSRLRDACLNIYHYNTPLGTNGVYTTEDTLVASIYYRRKFTPYRWETLYLPFEVDRVTVLEDGEEYDLTAWDIVYGGHYFIAKPDGWLNMEIIFGFTDELDAHTPYIIQFKDDYYRDKIITFYGKESWNKLSTSFEVLSSSSWMQIAGNTTLQDQLLEKPVYMLRSGLDFILQKTTTTLHPFECYVMPYATPSGTPARMNVRFRGDVPTAVESVKGNESHLTYTVDGYTLTVYPQGQAFSIYSLNGALIYSCEAGKEAVDCELNSGCYLLHAGTEAHKIML